MHFVLPRLAALLHEDLALDLHLLQHAEGLLRLPLLAQLRRHLDVLLHLSAVLENHDGDLLLLRLRLSVRALQLAVDHDLGRRLHPLHLVDHRPHLVLLLLLLLLSDVNLASQVLRVPHDHVLRISLLLVVDLVVVVELVVGDLALSVETRRIHHELLVTHHLLHVLLACVGRPIPAAHLLVLTLHLVLLVDLSRLRRDEHRLLVRLHDGLVLLLGHLLLPHGVGATHAAVARASTPIVGVHTSTAGASVMEATSRVGAELLLTVSVAALPLIRTGLSGVEVLALHGLEVAHAPATAAAAKSPAASKATTTSRVVVHAASATASVIVGASLHAPASLVARAHAAAAPLQTRRVVVVSTTTSALAAHVSIEAASAVASVAEAAAAALLEVAARTLLVVVVVRHALVAAATAASAHAARVGVA